MLNYEESDKFELFIQMFQNNRTSLRIKDYHNFLQSISTDPDRLFYFTYEMLKVVLNNKSAFA